VTSYDHVRAVNKLQTTIYIFGGIQVLEVRDDLGATADEDRALLNVGFVFQNDMWSFKVEGKQWEKLDVLGISEINREVINSSHSGFS